MDESCQVLDAAHVSQVPISETEYNEIFNLQQTILAMVASNGDTQNILDSICRLAENLLPNSVASVMLINPETKLLNIAAAPSIPQAGHNALSNLKPGPHGGSCGNAVFKNEPQYVVDAKQDERWEDIREVAYNFNLCSCWSMPIKQQNKAIGSFALSSFEHRSPAPFHQKLLEAGASIISIVLKNEDHKKRINLFSAALDSASEGVVITDEDNKIVEVNKAFERIYGYTEEEVLNKNPNILSSSISAKGFYEEMWNSLESTEKWSGEITNKDANGKYIHQWLSISAIKDEKDRTHNYLAIFSDLTELKRTQDKIEYMAYHDPLTGLFNKTYLQKLFDNENYYTLILLNVNNFSYINTAYGFETGDKLLVKIAKILKQSFEAHSIYRVDSDQFAFVIDHKIDIYEYISNIQNFFYTKSITIYDITINISFSYGAVYANTNRLQSAALALKQAKENGKNRIHIFKQSNDTIDDNQRRQFIFANNLLHKALNEDKFVPFFQGIWDNEKKKITKYEVLARIVDRDEIITPYTFLGPAKLSGLLSRITKVIIDKSFKTMSTCRCDFSINITEDDLNLNYLIDYIEQKAHYYNIDTQRVTLEILEGISANGKKNNIKQLLKLKELGYKLAIDDFGAEYSNFERILDLDIDFIKIDAKYIKDIHNNPKSYEITKAIAYFAKNADVKCIAEFVHSQEVQQIVEDLGIEFSQGYLFSEPKERFEEL